MGWFLVGRYCLPILFTVYFTAVKSYITHLKDLTAKNFFMVGLLYFNALPTSIFKEYTREAASTLANEIDFESETRKMVVIFLIFLLQLYFENERYGSCPPLSSHAHEGMRMKTCT